MATTTNWKFKDGVEPQGSSDGFWYDLTRGGYIHPEELLDDKMQLAAVEAAISTLVDFEKAMNEAELINEF